MLLGEEAAPRLAEHVVPVGDAEVVDEGGQLADEEVDGPEVGAAVRMMCGPSVAQLVVEDDGAATVLRVGEVGQRREVVVGGTGSAVQHDERRRAVRTGRQIAVHLVPGPVPVELGVPLRDRHPPTLRGLRTQVVRNVS